MYINYINYKHSRRALCSRDMMVFYSPPPRGPTGDPRQAPMVEGRKFKRSMLTLGLFTFLPRDVT